MKVALKCLQALYENVAGEQLQRMFMQCVPLSALGFEHLFLAALFAFSWNITEKWTGLSLSQSADKNPALPISNWMRCGLVRHFALLKATQWVGSRTDVWSPAILFPPVPCQLHLGSHQTKSTTNRRICQSTCFHVDATNSDLNKQTKAKQIHMPHTKGLTNFTKVQAGE